MRRRGSRASGLCGDMATTILCCERMRPGRVEVGRGKNNAGEGLDADGVLSVRATGFAVCNRFCSEMGTLLRSLLVGELGVFASSRGASCYSEVKFSGKGIPLWSSSSSKSNTMRPSGMTEGRSGLR